MKLFLIIILCFILPFFGQTQSVIEVNTICDNEVNTDWNNPTNDNLPLWDHDSNPSTPNVVDNRFLNGLNWVNGNTAGNGYLTNEMFFSEGDPYGNMSNIKPLTQPNPWYNYIYYGEQMSPENGWEMLLNNLGFFPNATDTHFFEDLKFTPYVVLYNRYTGIIRVFVTYGKNPTPNDAIDGVKIDLSFVLNGSIFPSSGLLRHGITFDTPLDQTTQVTTMSAVAKNPGGENKWYSADFKVAYDPCTCQYPSRLSLKFNWFSETSFGLTGRQLTLTEPLTDAVNKELVDKDFLGAFEYNSISKKPENGFIIYNSLEKAVDDYLAQMEKYRTELAGANANNAAIKRNIAIVKAFKAVILVGVNPTSAIIAGVSITSALSGGAPWATDLVNNAGDLIQKDTIKFYTLKKETQKLLGAQFDFFGSKYFKEKPAPTKPSQPMVSYSEMSFKGSLVNELPIPGPDFKAPGTFKNSDPLPLPNDLDYPFVYKLPIYNEVLGTFALMETPRFTISTDIQESFSKPIQYYWSTSQVSPYSGYYQSWTENIQIKMENDLKFALNSVLDIKSYSIEVAIEVKDSIIYPEKNGSNYLNGFQYCYTNPDYTTNLASLNSDVNSIENIYNFYAFQNGNEFNTAPGTYLYRPYFNSSSTPTYKKRTRKYRSEFIPKDAFYESVYEFGIKNERISNPGENTIIVPENYGFKNNIELEMKVLVEIEFTTLDENGENNKIVEIFTYKIPTSNLTFTTQDIFPNLSSSNFNIDFPKNLNFNNVNFNGANISGCALSGSSYTCKARENISLSGNISTASGYNVTFIAGEEIVEFPESVINGEITRQITPFYNYSHSMPQVDQNYIQSYCQFNNANSPYKADIPAKLLSVKPIVSEEYENLKKEINWDFIIYPNPTSLETNIVLSGNNSTNYSIEVIDMTGKIIHSRDNNAEVSSELELNGISKGVYFVKVNTLQGSKMKQLIIQ